MMQQFYQMSTQTPFQLLQRRDKQRKQTLQNVINKKDLKKRSASYNMALRPDQSDEKGQKISATESRQGSREQNSRVKVNCSLKKSFFYRKLLNRSIDSALTSDDITNMKQELGKAKMKAWTSGTETLVLRNIWEKRFNRSRQSPTEQHLLVVSHQNKEYQVQPINTAESTTQKQSRAMPRKKVSNIIDVNQDRKAEMNFDLEILGNKKTVVHVNKKEEQLKKTVYPQAVEQQATEEVPNKDEPVQIRKCCDFLQRYQKNHMKKDNPQEQNPFFRVSKIGQTLNPIRPFLNTPINANMVRKYNLDNENDEDDQELVPRYSKTSYYRSGTVTPSSRLGVPVPRRNLRRSPKNPSFVNDIQGWGLSEQQQDILEVFDR